MRRAIGIVRVSRRAGREGDSFVSPSDQAKRIREACERDGLELTGIAEEIEVSGGTPLGRREKLREAVEAVEEGRISVVVVAYFDRLVRSLRVQSEVVSRVEAAGGQVLAIDIGTVSEKTASQWLSGTMLGAVAEYHRRSSAERSAEAQADAVARGVPPFPLIPPGLERDPDRRLVPSKDAPVILEAFEMRAERATVKEVRAFLADRGIGLSYHGVQGLLSNRLYLGEIHFGALVNLAAHEPIIPRDLFNRVQRVKVSRGRRPKSQRLLARLGVLRCGSCGARMVVGTVRDGSYPFYRCPPTGDCPRRVTISADIAEAAVVAEVKRALDDIEARVSIEQNAREAGEALERAQADLDAAIRAFAGIQDEPVALERLTELRNRRDEAEELVEQLGGAGGVITISAADWDRLTLDEQRDLVRATIEIATIAPGRGPDRISFKLFTGDPSRRTLQHAPRP